MKDIYTLFRKITGNEVSKLINYEGPSTNNEVEA